MATAQTSHESTGIVRYSLDRVRGGMSLTPLRITAAYLLFGFAALYVSDVLLVQLIDDPAVLLQVQTLKGGVEVVVTGGLIFVLTHQSHQSLARERTRVQRQRGELDLLHRVLRHNLRNDLNIIQGYAETLREGLDEDQYRELCEDVLERVGKIAHYAEQAQQVNKASREDMMEVTDLGSHLSLTIDRRVDIPGDVEFSMSAPETAEVEANEMVLEAVVELVRNAIEHNDAPDPSVSVDVDPTAGPPHMTEVSVTDNGPGIPEYELEALERQETDQLVHLSGMGLWFVHHVVTTSNGTLAIENRDSRGTTVRMRLPKSTDAFLSGLVPE